MNLSIMQAASALPPALCAMLIAFSLPACTRSDDYSIHGFDDLERWQATVWQQHRTAPNSLDKADSKAPPSTPTVKQVPASEIAASRDPFAPLLSDAAARNPGLKRSAPDASASAGASQASEAPAMHLLGTVSDGEKIYALIEAGKRVHCIAENAPLPSYPITVVRIADNAVELDRQLPDGGHRRSTLRQGE